MLLFFSQLCPALAQIAAAAVAFTAFEKATFEVKKPLHKTPTKHLGSGGKRPQPPITGDYAPPAKKHLLSSSGALGDLAPCPEGAASDLESSMLTDGAGEGGTQPTN